jgi:hypothetical protein
MPESEIPWQRDERVAEGSHGFVPVGKIVQELIDFCRDLRARCKGVDVPMCVIKSFALEVAKDLAPQQESVLRIVSPIQCARPFTSLLIRAKVLETAVPAGENFPPDFENSVAGVRFRPRFGG